MKGKLNYTLLTPEGAVLATRDTLDEIKADAKRQPVGTYYIYEFEQSDGDYSEHDPRKHFEYIVKRRIIGTTFRLDNNASNFKGSRI